MMTEEGYGQAYRQGYRRTVRILCARGAPVNFAEDIAQAAWLRGWQKLDQLRDEGMIASWVNTIAMNFFRRGSQLEARYQVLPELCGHVGIDLAPLDAARILNLCRPQDRVLFEQQMGGLTTQEIAKKQGVTATAIRIRFLRARRAARAALEGKASKLRESFRMRERAAVA